MGCGKSTVGKILSQKLKCNFIDMDDYIVNKLSMDIPQIFAQKGEQFFRDTETSVIRELSDTRGIIACGGGAMLRKINADIASENGIVVFIDTPFETCYNRIKNDTNRPLVQKNTYESLHNIYKERKMLYKEHSDFTIFADGSPTQIADGIITTTYIPLTLNSAN